MSTSHASLFEGGDNIVNFSEPISIRFGIFISKISLRQVSSSWRQDEQMSKFFYDIANFSEPNRIRFGIFFGLNIVFLFPNRIQFGSENLIEFCKNFFPNRIGIGSEMDTE